jgi:hypothetical protein
MLIEVLIEKNLNDERECAGANTNQKECLDSFKINIIPYRDPAQ